VDGREGVKQKNAAWEEMKEEDHLYDTRTGESAQVSAIKRSMKREREGFTHGRWEGRLSFEGGGKN